MYKQLTILAFACALAAGCRDNSNTPVTGGDMAGNAGGGGGGGTAGGGGSAGGTSGGADMTMASYTMSTIAAMRTAGTYGNFEIDNVVLLAVNPAGTHMYVQDSAGGILSAIDVQCSGSSHPCTYASANQNIPPGHSLTLKGLYEKGSAANAGYETFYLAVETDNGAATTIPPAATVTMADILKTAGTASRNLWSQKVTLTLTDSLVLYDYSPAEFKYTPTAPKTCPNNFGFGMVPGTGAPTPPAACDASCATITTSTTAVPAACVQPAPNATANANEILIGTDFYDGFNYSADCECYKQHSDVEVLSTNTVASGTTISGILVHSSTTSDSATGGYLYLAPTSNATGGDFVFAP